MNPKAMFSISYGLYIVCSEQDGRDNGCVTNTLGQVTSTPNQVSLTVNKANLTHDMIFATNRFTASVVSQDASFDLFRHFGFQSGRDVDKFASYTDCFRGGNGVMTVTGGTNAWLSAWVTQKIDLGTHTLFIATVTDMEQLTQTPSATYTYYQQHIKPRPQPAAPKGKTVWRCRICGYEIETEELPDDFICPICKHGKSDFEKVTV